MKNTLSTYQAAAILQGDQYANFSRSGALAIVEYLEELEDSTGEAIEFDSVAIRCDWSEYESLQDFARDYTGKDDFWQGLGIDLDGSEDEEERDELIGSFIMDHGQLIQFDGGIIVSSF